MVCKAFAVLTAIVKIERHAHMFADPNALNTMCERIALPNISMRSKCSCIAPPGKSADMLFLLH